MSVAASGTIDDVGGLIISRHGPFTGDSLSFRLISDCHLGAHNFDEALLLAELEDAKACKDRLLINGDLFDLILPGDLKRFRPGVLHPRLQGRNDIVNAVLEWAYEIFEPYLGQLDLVGVGNHETSLEKHSSTDLVALLLGMFNGKLAAQNSKHSVWHGGYAGMAIYDFNKAPFVVYYHHGWGSGSTLSSAAGDWNRLAQIEGCDLLWLGHKHVRLNAHICKLRPPLSGFEPEVADVRLVRTGAYLTTYGGQSKKSLKDSGRRSNYAADAGMSAHGRGGARVVLSKAPRKVVVIQ